MNLASYSSGIIYAALALIAWITTIAAIVLVIVVVAVRALEKAEAKDVPKVLEGVANLVKVTTWLRDLALLLGRFPAANSSGMRPPTVEQPPTSPAIRSPESVSPGVSTAAETPESGAVQ